MHHGTVRISGQIVHYLCVLPARCYICKLLVRVVRTDNFEGKNLHREHNLVTVLPDVNSVP